MQVKLYLKYFEYVPENVDESLAPIVLLHSILESKSTWLPIAPKLAHLTKRKVYSIDARNHGESPWTDDYDIELMAQDLDDFLQQMKITKVVLVGHSVGGKVAITLAVMKPEIIEKLIIEDSTPKNFAIRGRMISDGFDSLFDVLKMIPTGEDSNEIQKMMREVVKDYAELLRVAPEMIDTYDERALPAVWNGWTYVIQMNIPAILRAVFSNKLDQNLPGPYHGEVLFIYGENSHFRIHDDPFFNNFFPRVKKCCFEKAGHFIHQEFPERFIREVANYVNSTPEYQAKL